MASSSAGCLKKYWRMRKESPANQPRPIKKTQVPVPPESPVVSTSRKRKRAGSIAGRFRSRAGRARSLPLQIEALFEGISAVPPLQGERELAQITAAGGGPAQVLLSRKEKVLSRKIPSRGFICRPGRAELAGALQPLPGGSGASSLI
jgi:hypothetical protein